MTETVLKRARWGTVAGLTVALAVAFLWLRDPGPTPLRYTAQIADASELVRDNGVRLNDVQVGKVTGIRLDGLHAEVSFTVAPDVALPSRTRIEVRQTSLLGELYLALVPEGEGRLEDGATIPLERTRRAHQLEEVVGLGGELFDKVTADQLNQVIGAFDDAFGGEPQRVGRFLDAMAGAVDSFNAHRDGLAATIEQVERMAGALAPHTQELASSVDSFAAGMRALDAHKDELATFTDALRNLSETSAHLLTKNERKLSAAGAQSKQVLGEITGNLEDFEKGLQALPDFNNGWRCVVQGHWVEFLAGVYPEAARLDTGGGRCPPPWKDSVNRETQGQVRVEGVPSQAEHTDDPLGTGDADLGSGTADEGRRDRASRPYQPDGDDGGLGAFLWTSAGWWTR